MTTNADIWCKLRELFKLEDGYSIAFGSRDGSPIAAGITVAALDELTKAVLDVAAAVREWTKELEAKK